MIDMDHHAFALQSPTDGAFAFRVWVDGQVCLSFKKEPYLAPVSANRFMRYRFVGKTPIPIETFRIVLCNLTNGHVVGEYDTEVGLINALSFRKNVGLMVDCLNVIEQHFFVNLHDRNDRYFVALQNREFTHKGGDFRLTEFRDRTRMFGKNRFFFAPDTESITMFKLFYSDVYPIDVIYDFHEERVIEKS